MRLFVIFSSIAICLGAQIGYNYQQPEDFNLRGNLVAMYGIGPVGVGGGAALPQPEQQYIPPATESFRKEFYTFSAPEEDFEDVTAAQRIATIMQKNLRVIFIRAPENRGLENAALSLAKHSSDDRTAIFVLNKQHDIGDLASRLSAVREQHSHRPEVHFVKYRTPEEAAHAQRYIQAQYDALQGSSRNADGGVAPVLNFASRQPVAPVYGGSGISGITGSNVGLAAAGPGSDVGGYNGVGAPLPVANVGGVNGIGDAAAYAGYAENTVGKINAQLGAGANFVFPSEGAPGNAYLPPLKAKH